MTAPDIAGPCERLRENLADSAPSRLVCVESADVQSALDTLERQAAELARMRGAVAGKRAFYAAKRDRHDPLAEDTLNECEKLGFVLEVIDHIEAALTGEDT
jgi:hypothetical protein